MSRKTRISRTKDAKRLPSEADILEFINTEPGTVGKREIARKFNIKGADRIGLKQMLRKMADDGTIAKRGKRIQDPDALPPVAVLQITGIDEDGELIAQPTSWHSEKEVQPPSILVLPAPKSGPHQRNRPEPKTGDRILAKISSTSDTRYRYEARIIRRLAAPTLRTLGVYRKSPGQPGRVIPIEKKARNDFEVAVGDEGGARSGELVAVSTHSDRGRGLIRAKVIERFGEVDDQRNISMIAVHQHGIPLEFPPAVTKAADALRPFKAGRRQDLRKIPLLTIDPADARDHDDAVWAAPDDDPANEGGFKVIVAIADVAHYVTPGSDLDREARSRGNSVYLPDRVIPMLPERLSTDLCSLTDNQDRPILACWLTFDARGNKRKHRFERAVMRSHASLSYDQAQAAIDGHGDAATKPLLEPVLIPLWAAYDAVSKARQRRQPLELDLPERKILLDEGGNIEAIVTPPRFTAHKLIEEFMIQANVAAAETLQAEGSPLLYRVHEAPSPEKIIALGKFLKTLGLSSPAGQTMKPRQFNQLLKQCEGRPDQHVVNEMVLRSQAQAIYSAENAGHFGLNLRHYAHFTSPIRRYADLIVHRALISTLKLGTDGLSDQDVKSIHETAELISATERRAMSAERETTDRLIASHLSGQIRARFFGRIAGVTKAGLFVRLDDTGADGFVPASSIGREYYVHDETRMALVGSDTGETYQLGDRIEVRLLEATPISGGLRFEILSDGKKGKRPARQSRQRRSDRKPRRGRR